MNVLLCQARSPNKKWEDVAAVFDKEPCEFPDAPPLVSLIFYEQRVAVSEPVVQKINIYPFVSFLRLFCLKIQLEIDFHPLF